jgi:hypothetical protein
VGSAKKKKRRRKREEEAETNFTRNICLFGTESFGRWHETTLHTRHFPRH